MIETLMVDDLRCQVGEAVARSHFKTDPGTAEERLERLLSQAIRPTRGLRRQGGMSIERARRMAADADSYDRRLADGTIEG